MTRSVYCVAVIGGLAMLMMCLKHPVQADDAGSCGGKGQRSCPLQAWMEQNMDAAVEKADAKALAAAFTRAASLVPDPTWNNGDAGWARIARAGATAAGSGDIAAAKKECKTCHKAWRDKYKAQFRLLPVPAK